MSGITIVEGYATVLDLDLVRTSKGNSTQVQRASHNCRGWSTRSMSGGRPLMHSTLRVWPYLVLGVCLPYRLGAALAGVRLPRASSVPRLRLMSTVEQCSVLFSVPHTLRMTLDADIPPLRIRLKIEELTFGQVVAGP